MFVSLIQKWLIRGLFLAGVALAGLIVAPFALSGPFEDGIAAYDAGDYPVALRLFLDAGGSPFAQAMIGHIYGEGLGVPRDQARSIYWYRLAADQGHAIAQYNLGVIHEKGLGVSRDYVAAVFWYRLAAEQGRAIAQSNLGLMYLNGQGVRTDFVQGFAWNSIAAGQGDAYAESIENQLVGMMTPQQLIEAKSLADEFWVKFVVPFAE